MKERGIIFNAPMVIAILGDIKTQTRRILKSMAGAGTEFRAHLDHKTGVWGFYKPTVAKPVVTAKCPYGMVGDQLWVREAFAQTPAGIMYRADIGDGAVLKYKPSIHMPRMASRILLQVTNVRAEPLQFIGWDDAMAEGYIMQPYVSPTTWYQALWGGINGPQSWKQNPWVWAVTFRRIDNAAR